jgi:16S rRNA (cytidine1402-2'-O)-methyltransferase
MITQGVALIHNIEAILCRDPGEIMQSAALYVVATPIGNLEDISQRALSLLAEVDLIAAEDTRRTRILLSRYGIETPMTALHEHNEKLAAPLLVARIEAGENVAIVSDAGTPLLSDPGFRLVRLAVEAGVNVIPVPGPSAVTAALSVSGLPTDRFVFEGFLPQRSAARSNRLETLRRETRTLVFFESSHRIEASLEDIERVFGPGRRAALCREMTKQFETVLRGSLDTLRRRLREEPEQRKGEFVLVLEGAPESSSDKLATAHDLARVLQEHLSASQAARVAARVHGVSRREVYAHLEDD